MYWRKLHYEELNDVHSASIWGGGGGGKLNKEV